jgi:hypothetical protein
VVALYEASDLLLQGSIELAESVACEKYFHRVNPVDPLKRGALQNEESLARFPWRLSRYAVENACTHAVTAGDHLANVHVRLAWEINAATQGEMLECGFAPTKAEPRSWITANDLQAGLRRAEQNPLGVFRGFLTNDDFLSYFRDSEQARKYRHAVVHRERPTYGELPSFGRTTLWTKDMITVSFPPQPTIDAPPIATYRDMVSSAIAAGIIYAQALWELAVRWLPTVRVTIRLKQDDQLVEIQTLQGGMAVPQQLRDPGAFIRS